MSKSEQIHILYMEDDAAAAHLLQKRLERAGYGVDVARDGEEGLTMHAAGSYDVLIVDQNMPVRDGLEVIRLLVSQGLLPPTIMVTSAGDEKTAVEAMKLGAGDYIVKDVEGGYLELLPSVIERVLHQQRLVEKKQRGEQLLQALNRVVLAMEQALTPEEIFTAVAEEFEKLGFSCAVFLTDEGQRRLSLKYLSHGAGAIKAAEKLVGLKAEDFSIPVETVDLYRKVVWERKTVFIENVEETTRQVLPEFAKKFAGPITRMLKIPKSIRAPLIVEDKVIGLLSVQSDDLTEDDVPAITAFAHQMAAAWRKAKLIQDLESSLAERKQAEEALRASEERFALAVQGSNDGIWDWDIQNNSLYWSPRLKELLGYADHELDVDFDTFDSHLHPDDRERMGAAIEAHLKDRVPYDVEQRLRTKSGPYRWFRARGQALWDEAGNPVRMVGFTTDITERKRAEARQAYYLQMERVLRQASSRFVDPQNLDQAISEMLRDTGTVLNANRAYLFHIYDDGAKMDNTHEWVAKETTLQIENLQGLETAIFPWWMNKLYNNEIIAVSDVSQLPSPEKEILEEQDILSILVIPIFTHGTLYGFFGFDETEQHREWESREIGFLGNAAQILGRALERAQAEEDLQRRNLELAALNALAQALTRSLELQDMLDEALSRTVHTLGFAGGFIGLADERTGDLALSSYTGLPMPLVEHLEAQGLSGTLCDLVYREGKPLSLEDLREGAPVDVRGLLEAGLRSCMGAPIVHKGRPLGAFCLFDTAPHLVSETEHDLLTAIGQQIGVAVENARLFEETRERVRRTELLLSVSETAASTLDSAEVLRRVARAVAKAIGADMTGAYLLDERGTALQPFAGYHVPPEQLEAYFQFHIPLKGHPLVEEAWQTQQVVFSEDARNDPRLEEKTRQLFPATSVLLTPMIVKDEIIGGLWTVWWEEAHRFNEEELRLVEGIVRQAAIAIQNARLFEETQAARQQAEARVLEMQILHQMSQAISGTLDLDHVLDALVNTLSQEMGFTYIALCLIDEPANEWQVVRAVGLAQGLNGRVCSLDEVQDDIVMDVARKGQIEVIDGWDERFDREVYEREGHAALVRAYVPLLLRERPIGVLEVGYRRDERPVITDEEVRLLRGLVDQLAVAIENARLFEELYEAKEAAEAATRVKSEFLANMSHEIRTPLNAVIGMTGLLLDTELDAEQQDYAETIRSSGDALLSLINDILDFSKIEAGKLELETQPFDLRDCVEESLDLLAPKAADKGLELAYLFDDQAPHTVVGDVTRLRQILVNLLSNAVKFTPEGEVVVSVKSRKLAENRRHEVHFAVQDTGIGIPAERMDRLFRSFSQVDASTTRKYGGTGLGLTISKRLAEMMGGTMWVESQVGQGSTFHFTILAEAAPAQKRVYLRAPEPELAGKRVLIVDDNATNRHILTKQAQSWGMLPRAAASGPEALEWIRQGDPFDIAILDMHMPEMDGLTLAAEIRKHRHSQTLPLVMLTSLGQVVEAPPEVSFAAYLTKPIKPSQLYDVLVGIFAGQPIRVREPAACTERSRRMRPQFDPQMGRRHPLRILLAEDNVVNQKVALRILERMGYRADVAANGLEVLEALERQRYDVVLMDVQMPEMDGLEATCRIGEQWPAERRPRIIAMTAHAMEGDRERYLEVGMDDYISKPVQVEELVEALGKCSSNQRISESANRRIGEWANRRIDESAKRFTAAEPPAAGAVDLAVLEEFRAMMGEVASELIAVFLDDAPKRLAELREAMDQGDAEKLERAAHTLKSSSANLGAMVLSGICKELEGMGRAGELEGAAEKVAQVEAEYERVKAALEEQME